MNHVNSFKLKHIIMFHGTGKLNIFFYETVFRRKSEHTEWTRIKHTISFEN